MWYEERSEKSRNTLTPEFSLCCLKGKVQLPFLLRPPDLLFNLMNGIDPRSKQFRENIRVYNSAFSFTSMGGKVENAINDGGGPPQFILSGQNYHQIGSLLPEEGNVPKFAQLYIYDTLNETANRMRYFSGEKNNLDKSLIEDITKMIDKDNGLAQSFRRVRDFIGSGGSQNFSLRLFRGRNKDARLYNVPMADEVAALIVGDFNNLDCERDVVVKDITGHFTRLHENHVSFIPLQYPLLFPYGEDGFQEGIPYREPITEDGYNVRDTVSLKDFLAFRIQDRPIEYGNVVNVGRLFQQFVVDAYTMIESQRLNWVRFNQSKIRAEIYSGLEDVVTRGEKEATATGKRVILPASFMGSTRYMFNNSQDAMAICKKFGYPDLFITMTCNSNWPEIKSFVASKGLRPDDRPDIVVRIFKTKVDQLMQDFKKGKLFGKVDAGMYTIEFQKRGLPHAHILIWLQGDNKLKTADDIDKVISAELPDLVLYPKLSAVVSNFMIHGPRGNANKKSPCMENGRCTKFFPKKIQNSTTIDEEGYPQYKRRQTGIVIKRKDIEIDNRYVVPYNPSLLMRYQAHINVEYCNKSNAIKYLFKHINKGADRAMLEIRSKKKDDQGKKEPVDEVKQYYDCRYLSPCEAAWRTFGFTIHKRWPSVEKLNFHFPNEFLVFYNDEEDVTDVLEKSGSKSPMFMAWFAANEKYRAGRDLTYAEFPNKFVYYKTERIWKPRRKGFKLGRLQYIPPGIGELYYMRILLTMQKGCTSYRSIRTVNGITYETFKEACDELGLLKDDKEYIDAIKEISDISSGAQMRRLFVRMLNMNTISKPDIVWDACWKLLSEGILHHRRNLLQNRGLQIPDEDIKNLCLIEIEKLLQTNGRSLNDYPSLPSPVYSEVLQFENRFIVDELNYDKEALKVKHEELFKMLTSEQKSVYEMIVESVLSNSGGFFFLYGYGGTGKTFVWNTLSASLRSRGLIALNVASSGIASLLLPGGRTTHSKFAIPLDATETSTCNIKQGSLRAKLLLETSLIIWDEAPMLKRFCFEALDYTLRDLMRSKHEDNLNKPFGGKVVILGGDFRQILPVIAGGSRQEVVRSTVNSSPLWRHCKVLELTKNMCLSEAETPDEADEIKEFADWILNIGNGDHPDCQNGEYDVQIPSELLIPDCDDPLLELVKYTYPDLARNLKDPKFFQERALLAPTLEVVEMINTYMLGLIDAPEREYLSSDSTLRSDENSEIQGEWFTTEFLNDVKSSGIPNHKLLLKVGTPIMLMRNIDQAASLCNGTRLIVDELGDHVIGATVITGTNVGDKIHINRMDLVPSDPKFPFKFSRRQFPISVCFAMTINKSQRQTLAQVGLFLPRPVFTHGQLYVALSRVRSKKGLKICILDDSGKLQTSTLNVVFKEVFDNV